MATGACVFCACPVVFKSLHSISTLFTDVRGCISAPKLDKFKLTFVCLVGLDFDFCLCISAQHSTSVVLSFGWTDICGFVEIGVKIFELPDFFLSKFFSPGKDYVNHTFT